MDAVGRYRRVIAFGFITYTVFVIYLNFQTKETSVEWLLKKHRPSLNHSQHNEVLNFTTVTKENEISQGNGVTERCSKINYSYDQKIPDNMFRNSLLPLKKYNVTFCRVPKGASTFWTRLLVCLERDQWKPPFVFKPNDGSVKLKNDFSKFSVRKAYKFLKNTKNLMFSRNPFSRVLSFYVDKLFSPNPFYWNDLGIGITKRSRGFATCGHDVTFNEFVDYIINTPSRMREYHIMHINDICRPCKIHYSFIGKMENFENDVSRILKEIGAESYPYFAENFKKEYTSDAIYDIVQAYFANRRDSDKCIDRHTGIKRVWLKLQIRGIISRTIPVPFTSKESLSLSFPKLLKSIIKARDISENEDMKAQKTMFITQAYSNIPLDTMFKLQSVYKKDLQIFNYDLFPKHLFGTRQRGNSTIDIFCLK
ncbi:CHST11 [Mytilus edulis]|uniref:Carbohydrate sulfotransferase n=1 Tax=Mytilus edulis TaxID=6550 RepID=A0A8S3R0E8_MYTED|nr:CHST11 [Mytilus edulis]